MTPTSIELRRYSRWLYKFIHRYDYGTQYRNGSVCRVPKEYLLRAKREKCWRGIAKLTEQKVAGHLRGDITLFYTGKRNFNGKSDKLLLCVDIDAHNGEQDALGVVEFIKLHWLPSPSDSYSYLEPSRGGNGIHLYFIVDIEDHAVTTDKLKRLMDEAANLMRSHVKEEGFECQVDRIFGLPSDWKRETLAPIMKMPRPRTSQDLQRLLSIKAMTLMQMKQSFKSVLNEVGNSHKERPSLKPVTSSSSDTVTDPPPPSPLPSIKHTDCDPRSKQGDEIACELVDVPDSRQLDLREIRRYNPLRRTNWTIRTLQFTLKRNPTLEEALSLYERLDLGTGLRTPARVSRFEKSIKWHVKRFDPQKQRQKSFQRMKPAIEEMIKGAAKAFPGVSLTYDRGHKQLSIESLAIGYYFALFQLGRPGADSTLPLVGIVGLATQLQKAGVIKAKCGRQKASAIRNKLVELGLLASVDNTYVIGRRDIKGVAMKYALATRDAVVSAAASNCEAGHSGVLTAI